MKTGSTMATGSRSRSVIRLAHAHARLYILGTARMIDLIINLLSYPLGGINQNPLNILCYMEQEAGSPKAAAACHNLSVSDSNRRISIFLMP